MAIGDFFRLILFADYEGELIENVFHYEQQTAFAGNAAQAIVGAFQTQVLFVLQDIQAAGVVYQRVLGQNLTNLVENFEELTPTPSQGAAGLTGGPPLLAMSFRSTRPDLSKRYSYKRFTGIPLAWITGESWNGTSEPESGIVATALAAVLSPGFGDFRPIQLKTQYVDGVPVYTRNYVITSWIKQENVTTQNSRKEGRGD